MLNTAQQTVVQQPEHTIPLPLLMTMPQAPASPTEQPQKRESKEKKDKSIKKHSYEKSDAKYEYEHDTRKRRSRARQRPEDIIQVVQPSPSPTSLIDTRVSVQQPVSKAPRISLPSPPVPNFPFPENLLSVSAATHMAVPAPPLEIVLPNNFLKPAGNLFSSLRLLMCVELPFPQQATETPDASSPINQSGPVLQVVGTPPIIVTQNSNGSSNASPTPTNTPPTNPFTDSFLLPAKGAHKHSKHHHHEKHDKHDKHEKRSDEEYSERPKAHYAVNEKEVQSHEDIYIMARLHLQRLVMRRLRSDIKRVMKGQVGKLSSQSSSDEAELPVSPVKRPKKQSSNGESDSADTEPDSGSDTTEESDFEPVRANRQSLQHVQPQEQQAAIGDFLELLPPEGPASPTRNPPRHIKRKVEPSSPSLPAPSASNYNSVQDQPKVHTYSYTFRVPGRVVDHLVPDCLPYSPDSEEYLVHSMESLVKDVNCHAPQKPLVVRQAPLEWLDLIASMYLE